MKFLPLVPLFFSIVISAESFVLTSKKRQPKITDQDCCQLIMQNLKDFSRIGQFKEQIQSFELSMVQDLLDNESSAWFKHASQENLQNYRKQAQKLNKASQDYQKALEEYRDFLKQEVVTPQKKK